MQSQLRQVAQAETIYRCTPSIDLKREVDGGKKESGCLYQPERHPTNLQPARLGVTQNAIHRTLVASHRRPLKPVEVSTPEMSISG